MPIHVQNTDTLLLNFHYPRLQRSKTMKNVIISIVSSLCLFAAIILFSGLGKPKQIAANASAKMSPQQVEQAMLPASMHFAGDDVPLHDPDVKESLDRELTSITYRHSHTIRILKLANRWMPVIEPILQANGIPDDFKYLAVAESGLENAVSPAGARGFWQFMSATAKSYGLEISSDVDERYHVEKATKAACKYLLQAKQKFGTWTLAAASYNRGMQGINTQVGKQKTDNYYDLYLNSETARYIFRILAYKQLMSNPQLYGFYLHPQDFVSQLCP